MKYPNSGHATYRTRTALVCVVCKALVPVVRTDSRPSGSAVLARNEVPNAAVRARVAGGEDDPADTSLDGPAGGALEAGMDL